MALQTNGQKANYHVVTTVEYSKIDNAIGIYFVGFQDKESRDKKWPEEGQPFTDDVSLYNDRLIIRGDDFKENILPDIEKISIEYCYDLLKKRVPYLQNSKKA